MFKSKNHVYGDQDLLVPAHLNFGKYVLKYFIQHKDKIALINASTGKEWTYRQLAQFTVNLSSSITELGIGKGDKVAVCSEKRDDVLPTAIAIICTGAIFTPIAAYSGKAKVRHLFNMIKPDYVICSDEFWTNYNDILKAAESVKKIIAFGNLPESGIKFSDLISKNVDVDGFEPVTVRGQDDTAIILHSSGTTGNSKGVMITHLNALITSVPECCFSDSSIQRFLCSGSWYHNYESFKTFKCFIAGKTMVYEPRKDVEYLLKDVEKYKINLWLSTPVHITMTSKISDIEQFDLTSLKIIYSRSFPLHYKIIKNIEKKIPSLTSVIQGYGMTEAGEPSSEMRGSKGPKTGSVGMPCPMIIMKVASVENGKSLGPNETGEIRIKGTVLMKGYLDIHPREYLDEEGFYKTGDLGYYDEDNYFYIVGRLKEIIKCFGRQVPPLELESVLLLHTEVVDAAVIGVPDVSIPENELPMAFVVKKNGSNVTEQDLIDFVALEVADSMKLRGGLRFITEIPRNDRGKIMRKTLLEIYNAGSI